MSARSKKERKQQELRDRQRRELARRKRRQARAASSPLEDDLRIDGPEPLRGVDEAELRDEPDDVDEWLDETRELDAKPPKLSVAEDAALGRWWDEYADADGPTRLKMTREKLETVSTDDDTYQHLFPEAILELESKLTGDQYVTFLEELLEYRRDVFLTSADWNTHAMVLEYLAQDRPDDVDRVVMGFAKELQTVGEPFFVLMSTVRLAGRTKAAQALIDAAVMQLGNSSLMPWAVDEVLEWAMFAHYQRGVAAGATDEAIEAVDHAAVQIGIKGSNELRANRRDVILQLAGKSNNRWMKGELITGKQKAFRKIRLLGVDYQRWLCDAREFEPIVADELRRLVMAAISGIDCPFNRLLAQLTRPDLEPYLVRKLGFMSLERIHAPATIVAMKHFYDFLKEVELVKPSNWEKSHSVCNALWEELQRYFQDEWRSFRFLERYFGA